MTNDQDANENEVSENDEDNLNILHSEDYDRYPSLKDLNILHSEDYERYPSLKDQNVLNKVSKHDDKKKILNKNSETSLNLTIPFCVILTAVVGALFVINSNYQQKPVNLDELKQIFPNQPNETFENFEAIIDDILSTKEIHPAVFLFLYDTNEAKANKLTEHLARYASEKLQTNEDYIDVPENEFHRVEALNDYGYLLDKYKLDLLEKKVMVVKNLQNIPADVAQVFHSFCDEISPLVERVVYIFTLKVDSMVGKQERIAETNLKRFWKELDNDILMPLITRVTSTVLKVLK